MVVLEELSEKEQAVRQQENYKGRVPTTPRRAPGSKAEIAAAGRTDFLIIFTGIMGVSTESHVF